MFDRTNDGRTNDGGINDSAPFSIISFLCFILNSLVLATINSLCLLFIHIYANKWSLKSVLLIST